MKKPSLSELYFRNRRLGSEGSDKTVCLLVAIEEYLSNEHAKKEEEKPPRLGMFDLRSPEEWEAQIKREAIKEFAKRLSKSIFNLEEIKVSGIYREFMQLLKEYKINL